MLYVTSEGDIRWKHARNFSASLHQRKTSYVRLLWTIRTLSIPVHQLFPRSSVQNFSFGKIFVIVSFQNDFSIYVNLVKDLICDENCLHSIPTKRFRNDFITWILGRKILNRWYHIVLYVTEDTRWKSMKTRTNTLGIFFWKETIQHVMDNSIPFHSNRSTSFTVPSVLKIWELEKKRI